MWFFRNLRKVKAFAHTEQLHLCLYRVMTTESALVMALLSGPFFPLWVTYS